VQGGEAPRDPYKDPRIVKKMAQLMMQGATMLSETCPLDGLPLFRLRTGEVVCPLHGRVMLVSSEEEAREAEVDASVREAEYYAAGKVREALERGDPEQVLKWLEVIEASRRILSQRRPAAEREGDRGQGRRDKSSHR